MNIYIQILKSLPILKLTDRKPKNGRIKFNETNSVIPRTFRQRNVFQNSAWWHR